MGTLLSIAMHDDPRAALRAVGVIDHEGYLSDLVLAFAAVDAQLMVDLLVEYGLSSWCNGRGRVISVVQAYLSDPDANVRAMAVQALGRLRAKETWNDLHAAMSDPAGRVRQSAAWAAGFIPVPEAFIPLAHLLDDPDAAVRSQTATALGQLDIDQAIKPLRRACDDPHSTVRRRAKIELHQRWNIESSRLGLDLLRPTDPAVPEANLLLALAGASATRDALPVPARQAVERAVTEMRNHPRHYLSPLLRQSVYRSFGHPFNSRAMRARGLLALITARRGLDQGHEGDWELIHLGEAVLAGLAVRAEACEWHESWSYRDIINWEADASTMAIEEVAGGIWCANRRDLPDSRSIDKTGAIYDTASMVAVIEARDKHSFYPLPARLVEFWEWWLNEAVPAAWAASRQELAEGIVS